MHSINHLLLRTPKASKLGQSKVTLTSIPPREVVTYAKETQTPVAVAEQHDTEGE